MMNNTLENRLLAAIDTIFRPVINKHNTTGRNIFSLKRKGVEFGELIFDDAKNDDFKIIANYPFHSIVITDCTEDRLLALLSTTNKRLSSIEITINGIVMYISLSRYIIFCNDAIINLIKGE